MISLRSSTEITASPPDDPQLQLVSRVCEYLESHVEQTPTLAEISAHVHVSPFHLQRTFKRFMGVTPRQYAEMCRLEHFKARLRDGERVTAALYDVGYSSSSRLYEQAPTALGMTPATYRNGGEGMFIRYSIVDCSLGRLLVGVTERGICAVHLGDSDDELEKVLFKEYPAAEFHRDKLEFCEWVNAILKHLDGQLPCLDLPLDLRATAFQMRVWQELKTIPYGETRTYHEIARAIGHPNAARAVAKAVSDNPVSLVIPCHRAAREDGSASAFYDQRNIKNKQRLLELEKRLSQHPLSED